MKRIIGFLALALPAMSSIAQAPKDRPNIDKLCGCFEVDFKYAETFSPNPDYKFHDRDEISGGTELTFPVEVSDMKIVMQHLLVISDSMIIKHWREEWTYENPVIWKYKGDMVWAKEQVSPDQVKGKWTQTVWEVSDAPRYQGFSEWVNMDGKTFWLNTADAPLPRREYSVRSDYNVLRRSNRIVLNDNGYTHEQDNQKIIRTNGVDKLLVEEKGINSYEKVKDANCDAARQYWEKNKVYWTSVRKAWEGYLNTQNTIEMKTKVDGKVLHEFLFDMQKDYASGKIKPAELDARIKAKIESFFGQDVKTVAHD